MQSQISGNNQLQVAVRQALKDRLGQAAEAIDVCVESGVVTLTGPVHSLTQRDAVIDVARVTPGVVQVKDYLHFRGYRTEW